MMPAREIVMQYGTSNLRVQASDQPTGKAIATDAMSDGLMPRWKECTVAKVHINLTLNTEA